MTSTNNYQQMIDTVKNYVIASTNLKEIGAAGQTIMFTLINGNYEVSIMPSSDYLEAYAEYRSMRYGSFCLYPKQLIGAKQDLINTLEHFYSFMDNKIEII